MQNIMKEELTTKMHSEFQVDSDTEIKHRVWALLSYCDNAKINTTDAIDEFDLTIEQVEKHKQSYLDLK